MNYYAFALFFCSVFLQIEKGVGYIDSRDIRLSGGPNDREGFLEINDKFSKVSDGNRRPSTTYRWRGFCSSALNSGAGNVACNKLGYFGGSQVKSIARYSSDIEVRPTGFTCAGNEKSLMTCTGTGRLDCQGGYYRLYLKCLGFDADCPSEWTGLGGYCYRLFMNAKTFSSANSACQTYNARLSSIHNYWEDMFHLQKQRSRGFDHLWLGLNDIAGEGQYRWMDGTPYDYSNWESGQPSDSGSGQDCVELVKNTGKWNDRECSKKYYYMCKKDNASPVITGCPDDFTKTAYYSSAAYVSWSEPSASDVSGNPQIDQSHTPNTRLPIGRTTVRYTFTDTSGNSATCSFTVTVRDIIRPVIHRCPTDINVKTELGTTGTSVTWVEPTATDNYGTPRRSRTRAPSRWSHFRIGSTPVTYTFTDTFYNQATCTFNVIVETEDTTPPEIVVCPGNITNTIELGTNETQVTWEEPSATDLSGEPQRTRSHAPGTWFPVGETLVMYRFIDRSNNVATCSFVVLVETEDTTSPNVTQCPASFDSISGRYVIWEEPIATDISEEVNQTSSHQPGMLLISTTDVIYKFTDSSDNIAECNFTVNVVHDSISPLIHGCPDNIRAYTDNDQTTKSIKWDLPSATDDRGIVHSLHSSHVSGQTFHVGLTRVTYIYADDSGNVAYCNFSIVVEKVDKTPPVVLYCPPDVHVAVEVGNSKATVSWIDPIAFDLSGNAITVNSTHTSSQNFDVGETLVSYTFVDDSENPSICNFSVFVDVVDTTAPIVQECPSNIQIEVELGSAGTVVDWVEPEAEDASGKVTLLVRSHLPGSLFHVGVTTVSYVFRDNAMNYAICSFTVTGLRVDTIPPTIQTCPSDIVNDIELGIPNITVYWGEPLANDLSNTTTLVSQSSYPGQQFSAGTANVIYKFADASGNEASCIFAVTLQKVDTKPPTIQSCPSDIVKDIELGTPNITVYWSEPSATDLSNTTSVVSQSSYPGQQFATGTTEVIYKFADASGNEATCNFSVTVQEVDTSPPTIQSCPHDIFKDIELGTPNITVYWDVPSATDLSNTTSLVSQSSYPGQQFSAGTTDVIYKFADASGNEATCNFTVAIQEVDTIPPTVQSCPADIVKDIELGTPNITVYWDEPSATDLSNTTSIVWQSSYPGQQFSAGTTDVIYRFRDASGNEAICVFGVIGREVDTVPPTIKACPSDIVKDIELGTPRIPVNWNEPSATDLSNTTSLVLQTSYPGQLFSAGTTFVIYRFADASRNEASCNFTLTLREVDTIPPTIIVCPSGVIKDIELGTPRIPVSWNEPFATDLSNTTALVSQSSYPGQQFSAGTTDVIYKYADESGNEASCVFAVSLQEVDTTPPNIKNCPPDVHSTIELGNSEGRIFWIIPTASDISRHIITNNSTHKPGQMFHVGETLVSYTFVDGSGNPSFCNFSVFVDEVDTTPPNVYKCPLNIHTKIEPGSPGTVINWTEPEAEDLSGNVALLVQTHSPGSLFNIGTTRVSYVFKDNANNLAACTFIVTGVQGIQERVADTDTELRNY